MQTTIIKNFVKVYYDYQKIREATVARIGEVNDPNYEAMAIELEKDVKHLEKRIEKFMANQLPRYSISEWIMSLRGLSTVRAAGLIAYIDPISRFDTVSKLWAYSGYGVVDMCQTCKKRVIPYNKRYEWIEKTAARLQEQSDKKLNGDGSTLDDNRAKADAMLCHCKNPDIKSVGQRMIRGQLADFNPELKKQVYLCTSQFIKQNPFYKGLYDQFKFDYMNRSDLKEEMESRKKGISKGTARIDAMARRKVGKIFLSHLWAKWRELEGLPVTDPYVFAVLGHSDRIQPPEGGA